MTWYGGSTPDGSAVVFAANDALTPDAIPGSVNVYEWTDGELHLVSVLPDGVPDPLAGPGYAEFRPGEILTAQGLHVVSSDGSRVFWTGSEGGTFGNLYVRENPSEPQSPLDGEGRCSVPTDSCTVQVDAAVGGGGSFQTASADGSLVLYTKREPAGEPGRLGDLFEFDVNTGQTTDLTPGGRVDGVLGASEDGSYIYYAVTLGESEPDDIYVYHGGASTLIATVENSSLDWAKENTFRTSRVSPNGRYLAFQSTLSLTGYENAGYSEVYLYDAETGTLHCASCSPSGARATGSSVVPPSEPGLVGNSQIGGINSGGRGWVTPTYQQRYLLDNGELVLRQR